MSDLFDFKAAKQDFAVIGNPVAHSKSPVIHQLFGQQCDIDLSYERIQVDVGGFDQAVSHFAAHGGAGLNVTVPFKLDAWELCQREPNKLSSRAVIAQAVNTLKFDDDCVEGDNTDGIGIVRDLQINLDCPLQGKRILVVGAGGAVRGVLAPLLDTEPESIIIVNRTSHKATALCEHFKTLGYHNLSACSSDRLEQHFDVVINGTAASLGGQLPDIPGHSIGSNTLVYDMMYAAEPTLFMKWSLDNGARIASDGLGMLVEQAAESFLIWHDQKPSTAPVIEFLRKS